MKTICFFLVLSLTSHLLSAQTKIQDASVNFSKNTLTLFLTDTASSVQVQLGTTFQAHDVFNQSFNIGSDVTETDDKLVIPLSNVTPGIYYVNVKVTAIDGTIQEMEFQTAD